MPVPAAQQDAWPAQAQDSVLSQEAATISFSKRMEETRERSSNALVPAPLAQEIPKPVSAVSSTIHSMAPSVSTTTRLK